MRISDWSSDVCSSDLPDIGSRGRGVAVIRDEAALIAYLTRASDDVLVQRYIGGDEFGVFVYRRPEDGKPVIYSITQKCFPTVSGDGQRTLAQQIGRASCRERVCQYV